MGQPRKHKSYRTQHQIIIEVLNALSTDSLLVSRLISKVGINIRYWYDHMESLLLTSGFIKKHVIPTSRSCGHLIEYFITSKGAKYLITEKR